MAISENQYNRLLARMTALEEAHNDVVVAATNYITLAQVNQLLVILQADHADLTLQVAALEARVLAIENEPLL